MPTQNESGQPEAARKEPAQQEPAQHDSARNESAQQPPAELAELADRWRRAVADLDNLRKRYARELRRERAAERDRVAADWLTVLDDIERALAHAEADPRAIVAGIQAVRDHAVGLLTALGYPRQDQTGIPFDTAKHEAVAAVDKPDVPPGTVVDVLRPGYGDGERQLRPAAVTVSRRG
ncbi:molecular chaperone GrpE [Kibdelosporangium banguiense]|uniref:Protein GrpE n=1 Tax=Kibdelosporangium banguiense TaxID=1365924 RepID=A0ABS4TWF0_9PSEU|nr:nucleotide exchange factor GrpE [Kibdelosporangium banguiense]MBP2328728.1 molecular chaperone GrpE [Kibdelosporangium banguiense]